MPFGAIYGALFFAVMGAWLVLATGLPVARVFLGAAALALSVGLLSRLAWARWGGVALAAVTAWQMARLATEGQALAPLLFLIGSVTAIVVLTIPATGGGPTRPAQGPVGRLAGWTAAVGACGFVAGMVWLGGSPPGDAVERRAPNAAIPASSTVRRVGWSDFGRGIERAAGEGRPLVVTFVADWCGYCKKMDRTTWKDPQVVERLREVVPVRVDVEDGTERNGYRGADLARRYDVQGTPALMLLDPRGRVLSRADGYRDAHELLEWLEDGIARFRGPDALQISAP